VLRHALFNANTKYDSHTAGQVFWQPIAAENVHNIAALFGMTRH